jgi:hypothetical protein
LAAHGKQKTGLCFLWSANDNQLSKFAISAKVPTFAFNGCKSFVKVLRFLAYMMVDSQQAAVKKIVRVLIYERVTLLLPC